jgi:hypothetical protein
MIEQSGLVRVVSNAGLSALEAEDAAVQEAALTNNSPQLQGLAAYIMKCWQAAHSAKQPIVTRLVKAQYTRQGKYDGQKLAAIKEFGGSDEYARVTANKSRVAEAWLRDVYLGQTEKPWSLKPTPQPALPPEDLLRVRQLVAMELAQAVAVVGATPPASMIQSRLAELEEMVSERMRDEARQAVEQMERQIYDQLVEGNFDQALADFLIDLTTFPAAHLKGPILRHSSRLSWVQNGAQWVPQVVTSVTPQFERVSPFDLYPSPGSTSPQDGYIIERLKFTQGDLHDLIGLEGFDEKAIRAALKEYGAGGLTNWLGFSDEDLEVKESSVLDSPMNTFDVLEFHGPVTGKELLDWGLDEASVADKDDTYEADVWMVGRWVIKAQLNYDPLKRRPYHKASWEEIPGSYWGLGLSDTLEDVQGVVNAAVRALINNMSIASGPQVQVNVDKLPPGDTVETLRPWKIWQLHDDGYGSTAPALTFFQPEMNANELLTVIEKFYQFADDWSLIPRYMSGNDRVGGAGRTASGLSMLFNAANKGLKGVVSNIDLNVITPLLEQLYAYNMMFGDPSFAKADAQVYARGAVSLMQLETLQLRRNEFLTATNNPVDAQIVGPEGRAEILREVAKGLEMDVNRVVPPRQLPMAPPQAALPAPGAPGAPGATQERLMNGAAVTDNFSPNTMRAAGGA